MVHSLICAKLPFTSISNHLLRWAQASVSAPCLPTSRPVWIPSRLLRSDPERPQQRATTCSGHARASRTCSAIGPGGPSPWTVMRPTIRATLYVFHHHTPMSLTMANLFPGSQALQVSSMAVPPVATSQLTLSFQNARKPTRRKRGPMGKRRR